MKPCYTEYVKHALRFFVKHRNNPPATCSTVDRENWDACRLAFREFPELDQNLFSALYSARSPFPAAVNDCACVYNIPLNRVWNKVNSLEKYVASYRGLV